MPKTFMTLAWPDANGPGESLEISTMSRDKTLFIPDNFRGAFDIEVADEEGEWVPARANITQGSARTPVLSVVARYMRINRKRYQSGDTTIRIGADSASVDYALLQVPENNGIHQPNDPNSGTQISNNAEKMTVKLIGSFKGRYYIEAISESVVETLGVMSGPGLLNIDGSFEKIRLRREGKADNIRPSAFIGLEAPAAAPAAPMAGPSVQVKFKTAAANGQDDCLRIAMPGCRIQKIFYHVKGGEEDGNTALQIYLERWNDNFGSQVGVPYSYDIPDSEGSNANTDFYGVATPPGGGFFFQEGNTLRFQIKNAKGGSALEVDATLQTVIA